MAASKFDSAFERDLADITAELVVHVEEECERLAVIHNQLVARRGASLPLGATLPTALPSSRTPELYERR